MSTVKVKRANSKGQTKQAYKARPLSHNALGYPSSLKRLLAGINSVHFKS